jgi:hypothetical protein
MGADLILNWCDVPELDDEEVARRVALLSDAQLKSIFVLLRGWDPPTDDEIIDEEWGDAQEGFRDRCVQVFAELRLSRAITMFKVHGHDIYVAGGMSWGDEPEGVETVGLVHLVTEAITSRDRSLDRPIGG